MSNQIWPQHSTGKPLWQKEDYAATPPSIHLLRCGDMADACRTCMECQRKVRVEQGSSDTSSCCARPLTRIAMVIVDPLPTSKQVHCFILTIIDYATKYLEAIFLCKEESETVAETLVQVFSSVGKPQEIITMFSPHYDKLFRTIGVMHIKTSPNQRQTGSVRINGMIKHMVKKNLRAYGVGQEATISSACIQIDPHDKLSPFELLHCRNV